MITLPQGNYVGQIFNDEVEVTGPATFWFCKFNEAVHVSKDVTFNFCFLDGKRP